MIVRFASGRTAIGLHVTRRRNPDGSRTLTVRRGALVLKTVDVPPRGAEPREVALTDADLGPILTDLRDQLRNCEGPGVCNADPKRRAKLAFSKLDGTALLGALLDESGASSVHGPQEDVDNPHILAGGILAMLAASYHFVYQEACRAHRCGESLADLERRAGVLSGAIVSILRRLEYLQVVPGYIPRWRQTAPNSRDKPDDCWAEPSWDEYGGLLHALKLILAVYGEVRVPYGYRCEVSDLAQRLHGNIVRYIGQCNGFLLRPGERGAPPLAVMRGFHAILGSYPIGWFRRDGVRDFHPLVFPMEVGLSLEESVNATRRLPDHPSPKITGDVDQLRREYTDAVLPYHLAAQKGTVVASAIAIALTAGALWPLVPVVSTAPLGALFLPAVVQVAAGAQGLASTITSRDMWRAFAQLFAFDQGEGGLLSSFVPFPLDVGGFNVVIFDRYSLHRWDREMAEMWAIRGKRKIAYDSAGWISLTEACRVWFGLVADAGATTGILSADEAATASHSAVRMEYVEGHLTASAYLCLSLDYDPEIDLTQLWPKHPTRGGTPEFRWFEQERRRARMAVGVRSFTLEMSHEINRDEPLVWLVPFALGPEGTPGSAPRLRPVGSPRPRFQSWLRNGYLPIDLHVEYAPRPSVTQAEVSLLDTDVTAGSRLGVFVVAWERDHTSEKARATAYETACLLFEKILDDVQTGTDAEIGDLLRARYAEFRLLYPQPDPPPGGIVSDDDLVGVDARVFDVSALVAPGGAAFDLTFYNERTAYSVDLTMQAWTVNVDQ